MSSNGMAASTRGVGDVRISPSLHPIPIAGPFPAAATPTAGLPGTRRRRMAAGSRRHVGAATHVGLPPPSPAASAAAWRRLRASAREVLSMLHSVIVPQSCTAILPRTCRRSLCSLSTRIYLVFCLWKSLVSLGIRCSPATSDFCRQEAGG